MQVNNQKQSVDLKKILNGNNSELEKREKPKYVLSDRMQSMMDMVDEERKSLESLPWSKLNKSKRSKLLDDFILYYSVENELDEIKTQQLKKLLHKSLSNNLLNKQSDINYNIKEKKINKISSLIYNETKNRFEIKIKETNTRVSTKSKTNIDRLANQSKKKNR
jgi:hypothetical protein